MTLPRSWQEALGFLAALNPSGMKFGLERVQAVLSELGHPEARVPALHVAGTNGKGSTCAFAASMLQASGLRVGLFTSPHLVRVNERFQIDRQPVPDEALGRCILDVLARSPLAATTLTYFEFGTVVAFVLFASERVDVSVVETGLGGRLDATNAVVPWVTAVTAIGLDHVEYLGPTVEAIAREKAGIFKRGVPAVVGESLPEALAAMTAVALDVGAPVIPPASVDGYTLGLRGPHQRRNAAIAVAAVRALRERGLAVPEAAISRGLEATTWPGRFETFELDRTVVLDGAHNPAGVAALLATLDEAFPARRVHLVFGVVADKDHPSMIDALFPRCTSVHLTPLETPRSLAPEAYAGRAAALGPTVFSYPDVATALAGAQRSAAPGDLVLCAGSLFLVGAARHSIVGSLGAPQHRP